MNYTTPEAVLAKINADVLAITDMKAVDRQHFEDFENYAYPSAFLNDVNRIRERVLRNCIKMDPHTIALVVFNHSEDKDLSTVLNVLLEKTTTKLLADPTLGGIVKNTSVIRIDTDEGFADPHCVGILQISCIYLTNQ